jgi:hypothetical protein
MEIPADIKIYWDAGYDSAIRRRDIDILDLLKKELYTKLNTEDPWSNNHPEVLGLKVAIDVIQKMGIK